MSPTQAERREATTKALLDAARELFASDGYAATSLDAVVEKAGVTKGALYHHFAGKKELFDAVLTAEVEKLAEALGRRYGERGHPWEAFEDASEEFFNACREPGLQRIFLLDAPGAIGHDRIREIEAPLMEMMQAAIQRAIDEGKIAKVDKAALATLLYGALCEGVMVVARSQNQAKAQKAILAELRRLYEGLAA